jgi:hypothetical protein
MRPTAMLCFAGNGRNLVFGDNGRITAAVENGNRFAVSNLTLITLGLAETISPEIGGNDTITTGLGKDIVFGGVLDDTIVANFGEGGPNLDDDNIVLGDNGLIDYVLLEREPLNPIGDTNAATIDRISTGSPNEGGIDEITTGAGFDLIFGGRPRLRRRQPVSC